MNNTKNIILSTLVTGIALTLVHCNTSSASDDEKAILGLLALNEFSKECVTTFDDTKQAKEYQELCKPTAGSGRHFRFEGVETSANNSYLNLLVGFGDPNDSVNFPQTAGYGGALSPSPSTGDGRWKIYAGKSQSCDKSYVVSAFSEKDQQKYYTPQNLFTTSVLPVNLGAQPLPSGCANQPSGVHGPSTFCFDLTKGSAGTSPRFTVWATGINGADCNNKSTLTSESKIYEKSDWTNKVETRDDRNYIYRTSDAIKATRIVVRSETVLK